MTDVSGTTQVGPLPSEFFDDPYEFYALARVGGVVQPSDFGGWIVLGHDSVLAVLRDPALSVEEHNVQSDDLRRARMDQLEALGVGVDEVGNRSILELDPPDHDRLRRLVAKAFNPGVIRALRPHIEQLVADALATMARRGPEADVIADLAFPLPFTVISEMLGMPESDRIQLRDWSHAMVKTLDPILTDDEARGALDAAVFMSDHVRAAIEWKRREPADDLLTKLIAAEDSGDVLTEDELITQVILLYIAGHETTVNLIGNGTLALLRHPDQAARLRDDPDVEENAIEELLRYDSPVQFSRRITTAPLDLGGENIGSGQFLWTCLASANRDHAFWGPSADELDLGRDGAAQHVSFGSGIHHCLGAALARNEGRAAIPELFRRFPALRLTEPDATPAWNGRLVLRGLDRLPVTLT